MPLSLGWHRVNGRLGLVKLRDSSRNSVRFRAHSSEEGSGHHVLRDCFLELMTKW